MTTRRISLVSLVFGAMLLFSAWLHASMQPPAELDLSRTRLSARGVYRATITPEPDTIRVGRMHAWTLHLETPDGRPVDAATIAVKGGMPQHGHGLPTKPRVTQALGHGDHRVEGMKFNMRGWWTVTFAVDAAAGADSVTFNLDL
jgi:hypothetical protein